MLKQLFLVASSVQFLISTFAFLVHDYTTSSIFALWAIFVYLSAQGIKDKRND